ncbi:MAG: tripartite tricarboxylate transporter substrate binding protein [Acidobacteriota bacterium]
MKAPFRIRTGAVALLLAFFFLMASGAEAQIKTLTLIAPAAPGGGWDQTARAMQQALQQSGAARIVKVVNIAGAGGTVGLAQFVSAQKGKGDVLLVTGLIMVGAVLTNRSPVTLAQVTPIARLTGEYEVLVVPAASPYKTLREFIAAWKMNPGLPIAGGSAGGTDHMLTGLLAEAAGVDVSRMNYVPHSGGGETIASLVGNQVPAGVNGLAEFTSLITAGRLRALAISSDKRLPGIDIPTFVEQGVNLTLANWRAVMAPPAITPQQRADLTSLVDRMRQSADWKTLIAKNNWIDMYQSGPAFEAFLKDEDARATTVLKSIRLVK